MKLLLVGLISLVFIRVDTATTPRRVELCEDVGERVRDSSILEEYRGRNLLLAFSQLHCSGCATRLLRLTEVARQFKVDVLVITPPTDSLKELQRATKLYPKLRFEAAPCYPCEFDYLLDTNSSRIFVLDSCARLLHRYERSSEHLSHLKAKFPLMHGCGRACDQFERRKRGPTDFTLPPVGCGPRKQITAVAIAETPYDARLQMLPNSTNSAHDSNTLYMVHQQQPATTSSPARNREYKQMFQQPAQQQRQTPAYNQPQRQHSKAHQPQPMVSVAYSSAQEQHSNAPSTTRHAPPRQAEPVQQQQLQVQTGYQQQQKSVKSGTRVQGRYQKYQGDTTATTGPPSRTIITPQPNRYNSDRLEEQRRQLAKQREEHARRLRLQNEHLSSSASGGPPTQIESPPIRPDSDTAAAVSFTQSFRPRQSNQGADPTSLPPPSPLRTTTPRPTASTTRRPPKTTKNPLVYSNQETGGYFGRRTYGRQPYESTYQMQQRRRNDLAAQRQRLVQEKQRQELEQLQRAELQRQIAEQAARQAAAKAAYEQKLKTDTTSNNLEAAPLYHDDDAETEPTNLADYYEDVEDWTATIIPQVRLESPPTPPPLPENPAEHPEFLFDLPCNGFTDEICYQQQSQLEPQEVHKCCQTRIVLTDQCVPGRCSNVTHQLCCIQKLLQSKFRCCNDKKQGEVLFAGDSFSRCCHENFVVEDDPCCPLTYSSHQWLSIYELCLPSVSADLSRVRVPQKVVAGLSTTVNFDFSKTDKWRFECKYGSHVPQYSYFPQHLDSEVRPGSGED